MVQILVQMIDVFSADINCPLEWMHPPQLLVDHWQTSLDESLISFWLDTSLCSYLLLQLDESMYSYYWHRNWMDPLADIY
jgi:hypothetical protein